jgi:transposase InsO family protein
MTKVKIHGWGWVYVHSVLDCYTKEIIGHYTSLSSTAGDWLEALQIAVKKRYPEV